MTIGRSSGDPELDMQCREALVEASLDELNRVFNESKMRGIAEPVIFLIDCEDEIGGAIARGWDGDDAVDSAILANVGGPTDEETSVITTLVRGFPFAECRQDVPQLFPYLAGSFEERLPGDAFLVVAVTYGGAGTFTVPILPQAPDGL